MASLNSNSRLILVLRHFYKQIPAGIEKRCVSSQSGTASRVNRPPSTISQRLVSSLHSKPSEQSQTLNAALLETCSSLHSLSIQNEMIPLISRSSNKTLNCLPVSNKEIRDNPRIPDLKYDLPKLPGMNLEINTPTRSNQVTSLDTPGTSQIEKISPGLDQPVKYANSTTVRMKRKKMRKHQRKRMQARLWALLKKKKYLKELRRKEKLEADLAAIQKAGDDFDPEVYVREKLEKAKKGGYMINILKTARKDKMF